MPGLCAGTRDRAHLQQAQLAHWHRVEDQSFGCLQSLTSFEWEWLLQVVSLLLDSPYGWKAIQQQPELGAQAKHILEQRTD